MSSSIPFQMNSRAFSVNAPTMIIEAADQLGIYIPRFCYHKKLSVVANCRMCLVEVEGLSKPVPACATQIMPNMHILTRSLKTKAVQRAVMEFLLINHPLDCPICDQGGQCELQDLAMRYGRDDSDFTESKRAVSDSDLGPLMATEMTRCIQCTRCVRFGTEVAGHMELGAVGRGENTRITTYVKKTLQSELAGNMIDVCPVGALTSKPFRFKARAWELRSIPSIAPHDCLGSHLYTHVHDQRVMRVVPRQQESINEVWLSDRDRYAYLGINSSQRLIEPMIKTDHGWQVVDWSVALHTAASLLKNVISRHGPEQLGGLISPSATLEEMYAFQKLCRGLGSVHIDHRLHETDTQDQCALPSIPVSDLSISELAECDVVMLIGSNVQREQPLLITRLRRVVAKGGHIVSLNCIDYPFSVEVAHKMVMPPNQIVLQLQMLVEQCHDQRAGPDARSINDAERCHLVKRLLSSKQPAVLVGAIARNHPNAAYIRYWVEQLKLAIGAKVMHLTEGANATGAWIAGVLPHRVAGGSPQQIMGMSAYEMIQSQRRSYVLFNVEPDLDCANPYAAQLAMQGADCVVSFSAFLSNRLLKYVHVLLPIHTFAEQTGTFVNVEGKWQSFKASVPGIGASRSGWEVLTELSELLNIEKDDDDTPIRVLEFLKARVSNEVSTRVGAYVCDQPEPLESLAQGELWRITEWPLYSIDPLVRHAEALQQSGSCEKTAAYIHPTCAARLGLGVDQTVRLRQGDAISDPLPVELDTKVPDDCVWTLAGRLETANLGNSFAKVEILVENA